MAVTWKIGSEELVEETVFLRYCNDQDWVQVQEQYLSSSTNTVEKFKYKYKICTEFKSK